MAKAGAGAGMEPCVFALFQMDMWIKSTYKIMFPKLIIRCGNKKSSKDSENVLMCAFGVCAHLRAWDYSNQRVSMRKKEWGWGRRNRAPLTEVRGVSSRRGGRGLGRGLISLEAWRLRLCVSDWLHHEAWCLARRPEMCVLNHVMCADVTKMCKQIHVDVAL